MLEVARISPLTGNVNKMYLDITQEQVEEWNKPGKERRLIQDIFPNLNDCLLYTSPSPRDQRGSRMPSSA